MCLPNMEIRATTSQIRRSYYGELGELMCAIGASEEWMLRFVGLWGGT